jgi:hypothetical protein
VGQHQRGVRREEEGGLGLDLRFDPNGRLSEPSPSPLPRTATPSIQRYHTYQETVIPIAGHYHIDRSRQILLVRYTQAKSHFKTAYLSRLDI